MQVKRDDMHNLRDNIYDPTAFRLRRDRDSHLKPDAWPKGW